MFRVNGFAAFFFLILATLCHAIDNPSTNYPIKRVSEDFYVGKIKGRPLWLVMERITPQNKDAWVVYAGVQSGHPDIPGISGSRGRAETFNNTGSTTFDVLLRRYEPGDNSLWVAYVTKNSDPKPIENSDAMSYKKGDVLPLNNNFARGVMMFMTVTSAPNAFVTSHMGISASLEGILAKERGISIDLHSFAAKVMRMQNPRRLYMMNSPVSVMAKIIGEALPEGSVFLGTREFQLFKERAKTMEFPEFKALYLRELENEDRIKALRWRYSSSMPVSDEYIKNDITQGRLFDLYDLSRRLAPSVEMDALMWKFDALPALMRKYPPLLSIDDIFGAAIENQFTIFDRNNPDRPWLTVRQGSPGFEDYERIIDRTKPSGETYYMLVDLIRLANCRALDPVG